MGPTASGKTSLAINLAQHLPVDIISVDSGMIYRGMDIGTAKPTLAEQLIAPHRLINICDPKDSYSAAQFREDAIREIEDILAHGRIPLLVGGTMLYFKILQQGISLLPKADENIRARITAEVNAMGGDWGRMHDKLRLIDPVTAARLSPQDAQRIQRALEVYAISGKPMSELYAANLAVELPYQITNIIIAPGLRSALHEKIAKRLQLMLQQGFVAEVEGLFGRDVSNNSPQDFPSTRAVGYRQVLQYLAGEVDYALMEQLILTATRQLAKRQLTWLRSWQDVAAWLDSDSGESVLLPRAMEVILKTIT